jgi:hypothetical protein
MSRNERQKLDLDYDSLPSTFLCYPLKTPKHTNKNALNTKVKPITKASHTHPYIITTKQKAKRLLFQNKRINN